jgi:hypothetical protein
MVSTATRWRCESMISYRSRWAIFFQDIYLVHDGMPGVGRRGLSSR